MQTNASHPLSSVQICALGSGLLLLCTIICIRTESDFLAERFAILFYIGLVVTVILSFTEEKRKQYVLKINHFVSNTLQQKIVLIIKNIEEKSSRNSKYIQYLYAYKGVISLLSGVVTALYVAFKDVDTDYFGTLFKITSSEMLGLYIAVYYGLLVSACVWITLDTYKKLF